MPALDQREKTIVEDESDSRILSRGDMGLFLAGVSIELGLIAFCFLSGVWRGSWWLIPSFFLPTLLFFAFILYFFRRLSRDPITTNTRWIILAFATLFHFTMLLTPQPLSNDIYRYQWDGKLLANGVNPYAYAPAADELAAFRDANWERIFNRDIPTGYPPLMELMFAANHLLNLGGIGIRILSVISSLGVCSILMWILRRLGEDERKAILYAWSPLVALEFGNSGHLDALAILALVLAFRAHMDRKPGITAFYLALGGLIKFFPALLAPFWGRRWGWRAWTIFVLVFVLLWAPFVSEGSPFAGLRIFAERGDFNSSLSALIQIVWGFVLQPTGARLAARLTSLMILVLVGLILAVRLRGHVKPKADWRFAFLLMGWSLLLSPVVHPWYICWMLVFITIEWETAWLVLSGSVIFARHVYLGFEANGGWRESIWSRWCVYLPFYMIYFIQRLRGFSWKTLRNLVHREVVLSEGAIE